MQRFGLSSQLRWKPFAARAGTAGSPAGWCIVFLSAWGAWAAASTTASGKEDFLPAISGLPEDGRGTYSPLKGQAWSWLGVTAGLTCQVRNLPRLKTRAVGPAVGGEHVKVPSIL